MKSKFLIPAFVLSMSFAFADYHVDTPKVDTVPSTQNGTTGTTDGGDVSKDATTTDGATGTTDGTMPSTDGATGTTDGTTTTDGTDTGQFKLGDGKDGMSPTDDGSTTMVPPVDGAATTDDK